MVYIPVVWYMTTSVWNKIFIQSSQPPSGYIKPADLSGRAVNGSRVDVSLQQHQSAAAISAVRGSNLVGCPDRNTPRLFMSFKFSSRGDSDEKVNDPETHVQSL